jgi:CubicO group peptidase (beta-lactamase class C family)
MRPIIMASGLILFWYWAAAAKTLTASLFGTAQEEGLLSISDKSSDYLGQLWTSLPLNKEDLIRVENQLSTTTGLDYQGIKLDCKADSCEVYRTNAGESMV